MKRRHDAFNAKRRLKAPPTTRADIERLALLASAARYGGNPEHKDHPGDFQLTPPRRPRRDKTLCDAVNIFSRDIAQALLREGIRRGLVSERAVNGWPQNVWVVTDGRHPLEAQLENRAQGVYHGYPLPENDPLYEVVLKEWDGYAARV